MPRYTAEQIYAFARQAGFSPDQSATMTAIALAESGGDSRSHNTHGEDSRGLWQINVRAHPDLGTRMDLFDPVENARAAFQVSHGGSDISPWTVTHGGISARYLRFRERAETAALAYGDGTVQGTWTGTRGYGEAVPAAGSRAGPEGSTEDGAWHLVVDGAPATRAGGPRAGEDYGIPVDEPEGRRGVDYGIPLDAAVEPEVADPGSAAAEAVAGPAGTAPGPGAVQSFLRSEEHTSELQS